MTRCAIGAHDCSYQQTLKQVTGKRKITVNEFHTTVIGVDASLNDLQLTGLMYLSLDRSDSELITPSHLLHGPRILPFPIDEPPKWV